MAPQLVRKTYELGKGTRRGEAAGDLAVGAFFFAMRSCEYSEVTGEQKTRIIAKGGVKFLKNKRIIPHTSRELHTADSVSITFVSQKNDEDYEEVTQHKTPDAVLNPVRRWASIIRRLNKIPGCDDSTPVNAYVDESGTLQFVKSTAVSMYLRASATAIGKDALGFKPEDISTHSLRAGGAMAMYLNDIPVYTIMLIGRWSSDAFLRYIRKQVQEFSRGVASRMIREEQFFHVPSASSREDPRASNNMHNFTGRGLLNGPSSAPRIMGAPFALWH